MYRGCLPRAPSYFLATAQESNQRKPPPDFVPSYLRRLPAKSPQLALRYAMGFRHTDFFNADFAVNMGHIRNGGKGKEVGSIFLYPSGLTATSPNVGENEY